jgi:peptidoglycan/xylan/chitin deacetylase (PgdA/CDA1 family)
VSSRAPAVVTTSWDDGDPLDLRLAEMLTDVGVAATFYCPINNAFGPLMTPKELQALRSTGVEIGSHTVNHVDVSRIRPREARRELSESKDRLEQILQEPVTSFCYPGGAFSSRSAALVAECGYEVGRTTIGFRTDLRFDPYRMPVTFQLFPHSSAVHVRHAVKQRNFLGLAAWVRLMGSEDGLLRMTTRLLNRQQSTGGVLHLWGHSWELEREDLWSLAKSLIELVAGREDVQYMTNTELGRLRPARAGR